MKEDLTALRPSARDRGALGQSGWPPTPWPGREPALVLSLGCQPCCTTRGGSPKTSLSDEGNPKPQSRSGILCRFQSFQVIWHTARSATEAGSEFPVDQQELRFETHRLTWQVTAQHSFSQRLPFCPAHTTPGFALLATLLIPFYTVALYCPCFTASAYRTAVAIGGLLLRNAFGMYNWEFLGAAAEGILPWALLHTGVWVSFFIYSLRVILVSARLCCSSVGWLPVVF